MCGMTEESTLIYKSKSFVLGFCQCGCKEEIPLRSDKGKLRKYKNHHHSRIHHRKKIECGCGCGGLLIDRDRYGVLHRFILGHGNTKEKHWKYRGGQYTDSAGYKHKSNKSHPFVTKRGYVREHRLVYEEYYKCCLLPWVDIHHKDDNPKNNNISNLQPILNPDHTRLHHKKDMSNRYCLICHGNKTFKSKKKPHHNYHTKWYKFKDGFICGSCYNKIKRGKINTI